MLHVSLAAVRGGHAAERGLRHFVILAMKNGWQVLIDFEVVVETWRIKKKK
tara:strand:- start:2777 stop:2929 length:153 start_codon:yes stop_codon:yes gene_type:complete